LRAIQSSNASGKYSCSGSFTPPQSRQDADSKPLSGVAPDYYPRDYAANSAPSEAEGLLHDARNLVGALGLYGDLLSMPGVLKPEHRQYGEDVRLLGSRSGALIERLVEHLNYSSGPRPPNQSNYPPAIRRSSEVKADFCSGSRAKQNGTDLAGVPHDTAPTISLRSVVDRCSGLLSRVAAGRRIEIIYGAAAAMPIRLAEEALERILVNLVRNAAEALSARPSENPTRCRKDCIDAPSAFGVVASVRQSMDDSVSEQSHKAIRIVAGSLINWVGEAKPWPFQMVRLAVEDSGAGMPQEQVDRFLSGERAPNRGSHGIGLLIVQELVATSGGDMRVMSAPGIGTRIEIEWPIAALSPLSEMDSERGRGVDVDRRLSC
jgi:signal transduction histidine kinase